MFEKVNPGHPDKMADRLAGAVVSPMAKTNTDCTDYTNYMA